MAVLRTRGRTGAGAVVRATRNERSISTLLAPAPADPIVAERKLWLMPWLLAAVALVAGHVGTLSPLSFPPAVQAVVGIAAGFLVAWAGGASDVVARVLGQKVMNAGDVPVEAIWFVVGREG